MDQSIRPIAAATVSTASSKRVYQHSLAVKCALSLAENSKVNELSLFELINVVNARIKETNGLDFVDKHSLFELFINVDNELQSRKDALEDAYTVNMGIEHADNPLTGSADDNDEHVHTSEITMAEWEAVRAIHAEVYSDEE